ncbi:hypothetical protein BSKO_11012 [Bryopsis sp. KO-2023]|nr:hypothetical protein BSKO_11012 [Bryopsis sp. KO-2023]
MLHKPQEIVEKLGSYDAETRLRAVRSLKNEIIGSKSKKLTFIGLGAVPQVVKILSSEKEGALLVQAAAALGSFAYGTEGGVRAVLDSEGVAQLLDTLSNEDEKVIESGVRSLKMLLQSGLTPRDPIFVEPALNRLVSLLSMQKTSFGRLAACVLARCCKTKEQQDAFVGAGALPGLLKLLESPNRNCQEAALDALSALSRKNDGVCQSILKNECTEKILTRFTKDRSSRVKLLACSTLTNLSSCLTPEELAENSYHQHKHILQVLVKLLNETAVRDQVPEVLSRLTERSQELQRAAYEADAVRRLCSFLVEGPCSSQMKEGILRCLGTLCMDLQECRKQIQDSKAIKPIVSALEDPVAGVRAAAACCVRGMTRSVKDLRADWIDESTTTPLVKLLNDPNTDVQENACSTLCNLLLEFTRVKHLILDQGLRQVIALTQSMDADLRFNAVWALKNLSFQLEVEKVQQVLRELPWEYVRGLLDDPEQRVQSQAMRFLQNMCSSEQTVIQAVMEWSRVELLSVVAQKLEKVQSQNPETDTAISAALRVASNVATGMPVHQEAVMDSGIPDQLLRCLRCEEDKDVRVSAVWCIINLTWRDELPMPGTSAEQARSRARVLRDIGIEEELHEMVDDPELDVRERVKTALGFFKDID